MTRTYKFAVSILVLALWIGVTVLAGFFQPVDTDNPLEAVSDTVGIGFVAACLFLVVVALVLRWDHMGFGAPRPLKALVALWMPLAYIALILSATASLGFPPPATVAAVGINMALVGFSEEVMFRGILLRGALARFRIRSAILISTAAFGLMHVTNGLVTGLYAIAAAQAVAAFMSGTFYVAVRIRSQSLWPMIVVHALWNFALFMLLNASGGIKEQPDAIGWSLVLPILLVSPFFLYGLLLLRHAERDFGFMSEKA